jgi:hypothetical protein
MSMAPARTSTAIPFGVWSDRADGGLWRAPGEGLTGYPAIMTAE